MKGTDIYQLLFENSGQGMILRQGEKITLVNQSFADIVGYTIDELLAFSMEDSLNLIHPLDREAALARFQDIVAGMEFQKTHEYRFVHRNGNTGWWSATESVIEYLGQPAVLGVYQDITRRKEAEDRVEGGRKLLSAILDVLPVGVCLTDERGHYRMMNDAYCAIYEYEREEILGQHYSVIMPPDQVEIANAHYARLLSGDTGIPVEHKRQRKDGSNIFIEAANALVEGIEGEKFVITTIRDITERKQTEIELRESQRLLNEIAANYPNSYVSIIESDLTVGFTSGQEFARQNLDPRAFVGLELEEVFGDLAPTVREHYLKAFAGEQVTFELSINSQHQLYIAVPLRDPNGNIPRILVVAENITERKQDELALKESLQREQYLGDIIRDASLAIGVAYPDGRIGMFNRATEQLTGYNSDELRTIDWNENLTPPEWRPMETAKLEELHRTKQPVIYEKEYIRKDGSRVPIELVVHPQLDEKGTIDSYIAFVTDISDRKKGEEIIRLRLRLLEYASTHSLSELMQKALDEIGELTGSPIGFYHYVEDNQKTVSLQAWSTRTLEEFCQLEGQGMHYPLEKAGVWTDCIYQKKPVIHNDYASLPHRKGLPEGHAEVVRQLVVPIMRDDQVVAILGVGNKASDYNEQDTALVTYIADLVRSVIEQKQSDEKIRQLNTKLERLAMTDDLTGLMNRRAFINHFESEVGRAQRYNTPLSLLVLDLDGFKGINDTFGHDAGDFILQGFSKLLNENVREIDIVARLGGEEFSILVPNTALGDAVTLAERIRQAVEQDRFEFEDQIIDVTVSIGVAAYSKKTTNLETLFKQADAALYQAKDQGRNQVVFLE